MRTGMNQHALKRLARDAELNIGLYLAVAHELGFSSKSPRPSCAAVCGCNQTPDLVCPGWISMGLPV